MPLYIAFIDLTKAFDPVSREGLFAILLKIDFPPSLFNIAQSFHTSTKATVQYDGIVSESFTMKSGVKQGCVFAPTLFGIFFSMLLKRAFFSSTVRVKLHTSFDGCLFNSARLKAKSKVIKITVRDLLFSALVAHSAEVLSQGTDILPTIKIDEKYIENFKTFV